MDKGIGVKKGDFNLLSDYEALFLLDKGLAEIVDDKGTALPREVLLRRFMKNDKRFLENYAVYKELSSAGYCVKTGLKYGAEFRVYDKGEKPGTEHSIWIVWVLKENEKIKPGSLLSISRIANST